MSIGDGANQGQLVPIYISGPIPARRAARTAAAARAPRKRCGLPLVTRASMRWRTRHS